MDHSQLLGLSNVFAAHAQSADTVVVCPDGETFHFGDVHAHNPLMLYIKNMQMVHMFDRHPLRGLENSYLKGFWDCNNIPQLLAMSHQQYASHTTDLLKKFHHSPCHPTVLRRYAQDSYCLERLSLEFFAAWYDPSLSASIGAFSQAKRDPLYIAQQRRVQQILKILEYHHAVTVLDLGASWGAFGEKACLQHDVTLVSPSRTHAEFCQNRLRSIPFPINYQIKTQRPLASDYPPFDAIVGLLPILIRQRDWLDYFSCCAAHLKQSGVAVLQVVFDERTTHKQLSRLLQQCELRLIEQEHLNRDAAKTYRYWVNNFSTNTRQIEQLGFSQPYMRLWQYYLSKMAYFFESGGLQIRQITLEKIES